MLVLCDGGACLCGVECIHLWWCVCGVHACVSTTTMYLPSVKKMAQHWPGMMCVRNVRQRHQEMFDSQMC